MFIYIFWVQIIPFFLGSSLQVFILLSVVALLDVSYIARVHRSLLAEHYVTVF
jgi:hypothetical protein